MAEENIGQMGTNSGDGEKSPMLVIIIVVIVIIGVGAYFLLGSNSATDSNTEKVPQEEQTLSEQISDAATDNPASDIPQANVFETETNPFSDDGFKNPFE